MIPLLRSSRSRHKRPLPAPSNEWAYFLDIDGTLLDVALTPTMVQADHGMLESIEDLFIRAGGAVALISGRTITDIDRLFPGRKLPVCGQHGVERRDAMGEVSTHARASDLWERVRVQLMAVAERHKGLAVEDKGFSLALHYRQAAPLASFAHQLMHLLQKELGDGYVTQRGKRVIELKPAGIDKGSAIRMFMEEAPFKGRTPVFLGDDVTDEYGFAVVNSLKGYSVKVGRGRTTAEWRLKDVAAVHAWLEGETDEATPEDT